MQRKLAIVFVGLGIAVSWFSLCWAAERSITLPKGTQAVQIGPGHFKFMLPDHRSVDVTGLNPKTGSFSLLRVIDKSSSQKTLWGGKQGRIINEKKWGVQEASGRQLPDYAKTNVTAFSFPVTLTVNEMSSDELVSAFLKLNTQDPAKSPGSDNSLTDLTAELRCKSKTGCKWNPNTKHCDCP